MLRQTGCLATARPACCTNRLPPGKSYPVSQNTVLEWQWWEGSLRDGRQTFAAFSAIPCCAVPRKMHFKVSKREGFQHDEHWMGAANHTLQTPP